MNEFVVKICTGSRNLSGVPRMDCFAVRSFISNTNFVIIVQNTSFFAVLQTVNQSADG